MINFDQNIPLMKKIFLFTVLLVAFSMLSSAQTAQEWNKKGLDLVKKYEYKEAYNCFTKAIELKADFAEAYFNRAEAWFNLPPGTFNETDGCADLKKAKDLGYKVSKEKWAFYGCD